MIDETKPVENGETTPAPVEGATPVEGRPDAGGEPSAPPQEPSQPVVTQEQYDAAVRGMNEAQRNAAESLQSAQRYEGIARAAVGKLEEKEKPAETAWSQFEESQGLDSAALLRHLDGREDRIVKKAAATARADLQIEQALDVLRPVGIGSRDELERFASTVNTEEFKLIKLHRDGKLRETFAAEDAALETKRKTAESLKAIDGIGGGRAVPGQGAPAVGTIPYEDWVTFNDAAKERHRTSDQEIVITGAPKHFDPSKD